MRKCRLEVKDSSGEIHRFEGEGIDFFWQYEQCRIYRREAKDTIATFGSPIYVKNIDSDAVVENYRKL